MNRSYFLDEYICFLKLFLVLNQDIEIFKSILNPDINIRVIGDELEYSKNKLSFYKAIKQEIDIKEEYLPHITLLQELINECE